VNHLDGGREPLWLEVDDERQDLRCRQWNRQLARIAELGRSDYYAESETSQPNAETVEASIMTQVEEVLQMDGPLPADLAKWWESFFGREDQRLALHGDRAWDLIDDAVFLCDLAPLQRKRELKQMLFLAKRLGPKTVFEIGIDKGSTLYHWCRLPTVKHVVGCEIRGTPQAAAFERHFPHIDFLWLPKSSYDPNTVEEVGNWLRTGLKDGGGPIDLLLVDGDKSFYERDWHAYRPLMSPGGIAFFHDITDDVTGAAWRRIRDAEAKQGAKSFDLIDSTEALELLDREPRNNHEVWLRHWHGRSCGAGCLFLGRSK
jgi:predicted O-methyltransferase YrrM